MNSHTPVSTTAADTAAGMSEVFERELDQIRKRRREAGQSHESEQASCDARKNLIGLALSGGGLRSAALSLGLLQALSRTGLLRVVDYLSTVSGGGLAGGYLSSCSLKGSRRRDPGSNERQASADGQMPADEETSASAAFLAPSDFDRQPAQVRRFLFGGNYLRRTWLFLNRYVIGLVLMWLVVISGLVAVTSLAAWLFRCIDYVNFRLWLNAAGFDGDLKAAFFPTFAVFWIWLILWVISYFKFGRRATGSCARAAFFVLVVVTAIGVAALFGTGDIDVASVTQLLGVSLDSNTLQWLDSIFRTVILTSIGASLLPYLTFSRLLKSGQEPKRGWEQWAFWIATRGLVYGVPLLMVGYFAKENISGYHEIRDDRFYKDDVTWEWGTSPLWHEVREYRYPKLSKVGDSSEIEIGNIFGDEDALEAVSNAFREYEEHMLLCHEGALKPADVRKLEDDSGYADPLKTIAVNGTTPFSRRRDDVVESDLRISFVQRWWLLARWGIDATFRRWDEIDSNPVQQIYAAHCGRWACQERIIELLNRQVQRRTFHETFLPVARRAEGTVIEDGAGRLGITLSDQSKKDLLRLKADAEQLAYKWKEAVQYEPDTIIDQRQANRQEMLRREQVEEEIIRTNRQLLKALYGEEIQDKQVKLSVVHQRDQQTRLRSFLFALIIFLVAGVVVDLNATSWHGYYGERIAKTWVETVPGFDKNIPLARLETTASGDPYHLINASIHLVGRRDDRETAPKLDHFLFSELYCGSERTGFKHTDEFLDGKCRLDDALAISGGAVTPFLPANPLVAMLLILFNARLGQWVPNPAYKTSRTSRLGRLLRRWPVAPLRIALGCFQLARKRRFCLVADGGHHDNLGIRPLLRRRCKLILACDASYDEKYQFLELSHSIRWARVMEGVKITSIDSSQNELDLSPVTPDKATRKAQTPFLIARVRYPAIAGVPGGGEDEGLLVYMKSVMCGDEPIDLLQFDAFDDNFPHDPASDQFYEETRVEAYRQLGEHIGNKVCATLMPSGDITTWDSLEVLRPFLGPEPEPATPEAQEFPSEAEVWRHELADPDIPIDARELAALKLASVEGHDERIVNALLDALFAEADQRFQSTCRLVLCERLAALATALPPRLAHTDWKVRRHCVRLVEEAVMLADHVEPVLQTLTHLIHEIVEPALRDTSVRVRRAARLAAQAFSVAFRNEPAASDTIDRLKTHLDQSQRGNGGHQKSS